MRKYDNVMMETALLWSVHSKCERAKVGAILAQDGRIISNGYNGTVSGSPEGNCCEKLVYRCSDKECNKKFQEPVPFCECGKKVHKSTETKNNVVHAEANAILFAAKNGIRTEGCTMYVTLSPCIECAKMIKQAGIARVVYDNGYRSSDGIEFLKRNNVIVENWEG